MGLEIKKLTDAAIQSLHQGLQIKRMPAGLILSQRTNNAQKIKMIAVLTSNHFVLFLQPSRAHWILLEADFDCSLLAHCIVASKVLCYVVACYMVIKL